MTFAQLDPSANAPCTRTIAGRGDLCAGELRGAHRSMAGGRTPRTRLAHVKTFHRTLPPMVEWHRALEVSASR